MKLVIVTQFREDYGWGESDLPFYKFKDGNTYELYGYEMRSTNTKELIDKLRLMLENADGCDCFITSVKWEEECYNNLYKWDSPIIIEQKADMEEWSFYQEVKECKQWCEPEPVFITSGIHTWVQKGTQKRFNYEYKVIEPLNTLT